MSRGPVALLVAVLAATTTGVLWWSNLWWSNGNAQGVAPAADQAAPAANNVTQPAAMQPATGQVVPGADVPPMAPQLPPERTMVLPDGTRVATLNGAVHAKPLSEAWPKDVPWSPIVRIERSDLGVDWYVHEDGSRSTTEMKWRSDLGREDAVTRLARPTPTAPNVPGAQTAK